MVLTGVDVLVDETLAGTVTVVVVDGGMRHVNGELLKVGAAVAVQLGVEVREKTALQQRVFGKVDAAHDVAGLEHDLLRLGEVVRRVAVQLHQTQLRDRHKLLGKNLGGVQQVKAVRQRLVLVDNLHTKLPLRAIARLNGIPEILTVEVGVLARNDLRLLPDKTGLALARLPMPLDKLRRAVLLHEAVCVDSEAILTISAHCCSGEPANTTHHVAETTRDAVTGHGPKQGVQGTRLLAKEVPGRVVGSGRLGNLTVGAWLDSVDQIREPNGILDEENRDIVSDNVWVG